MINSSHFYLVVFAVQSIQVWCLESNSPYRSNKYGTSHLNFIDRFTRNTKNPSCDKLQYGEGTVVKISEICSATTRAEIRNAATDLECDEPKPTIVKLQPPGPNFALLPSVASVKRCSGHCMHPRECLPVEKTLVKKVAYRLDHLGIFAPVCLEMELEQHEKCQCGCSLKREQCNKAQVYREDLCSCVCSNQKDKEQCLEGRSFGAYWDSATCSCKCRRKRCSSNSVWIRELCRCSDRSSRWEELNDESFMDDDDAVILNNNPK